jgi:uncharacterized protein DUF6232
MKSETIEVRVERGILWVGADAYPLHNIARARTVRLVPNRAWAVRRFVLIVVLCVLLGIAGAGALQQANRQSSESDYHGLHNGGTAAVVVALSLLAIGLITLLVRVSRRTFYALVIETAGTSRGVLVSTNQAELGGLVRTIMEAIHNPATPPYQNTFVSYDMRGAQGVQIGDGTRQDNAFKAA